MKLELLTSIDSLESEWNSLLPHNATNEVFLTWEWQHSWWESYHPGNLWVLVARDENGELMGIAPWFIEQPSRTIRSIGCVEVTDYLDILVKPEYRETFAGALADYLIAHKDAYSCLDFCNIPGTSPTLDALPRSLSERGFSIQVKQQEVCPTITLPADFEGYLANLDKKQRHESRRKLRRIEENTESKIGWYIVGPEHNLDEQLEMFLKLMAASHPNKEVFLQDPQNTAFFRSVMPKLARCGWLHLSFLTVDEKPVATYLNFDFNNRILVYNSGLLTDGYSQLSAGIVLLLYNIQYAIEQGRGAFDFLRGNEEYKYRMGAQDHPVMMLEARLEN